MVMRRDSSRPSTKSSFTSSRSTPNAPLTHVAPFDDRHGVVVGSRRARGRQLADVIEAVDVDVHDPHAARVLARERERRAHDGFAHAEPVREARARTPSSRRRGHRRAARRHRRVRARSTTRAIASVPPLLSVVTVISPTAVRITRSARAPARASPRRSRPRPARGRCHRRAAPPPGGTWGSGPCRRVGELRPRSFVMPVLRVEQQLGGEVAEGDDDPRPEEGELAPRGTAGTTRSPRAGGRGCRADGTSRRWRCTRRSRVSPIPSMSRVSSCPARPTNGMPCSSSSAPGPSPTNIRSASGSPTPNTTWVRVSASGQRVQPRASSRRASRLGQAGSAVSGPSSSEPSWSGVGIAHQFARTADRTASATTSAVATRSRSRCAATTPVATATTRSPSKRVCDGSSARARPWWPRLGEQEAVRLREQRVGGDAARASCARRRRVAPGTPGRPGAQSIRRGSHHRGRGRRRPRSPRRAHRRWPPRHARSRCPGRPPPRDRRPATCRRGRRGPAPTEPSVRSGRQLCRRGGGRAFRRARALAGVEREVEDRGRGHDRHRSGRA